MRKIRKIAIQNAAGLRWSLDGESGVYATDLSGLGFTLSPTYADLTRGFFLAVGDENEPQGSVPFTVFFTRNPYEVYQRFVDWLAAAGTLTIVYNPTGAQEFLRDVSVNFAQKGELNEVGWLEVPVSFYATTPWYKPIPTSLALDGTGKDESKRYDYRYTEDLRYGSDSSAALSGTVFGSGHIPGALELTYTGGITNPQIRLVGDVSGKTYGICSLTVTLLSTDLLRFSSRYERSFVQRVAADGTVTDLLDALDLSTTPFFHLPVDESCTLSIESDAPFEGTADLTVYYYYRSV